MICKPGHHHFALASKPCDCQLWLSRSEFNRVTGKKRNVKTGRKGYTVNQYRPDGTLVATYKSLREAERASGINHSSMCLKVKKDYNKQTMYLWKLA